MFNTTFVSHKVLFSARYVHLFFYIQVFYATLLIVLEIN